MNWKRGLCLLLSVALFFSIGLPGTLATEVIGLGGILSSTDTTASGETAEAPEEGPAEEPEEAPEEDQEETEEPTDPEEDTDDTEAPTDPEEGTDDGTTDPTDPEEGTDGGTTDPTDPEEGTDGGTTDPTDPEEGTDGGTTDPTDPEEGTDGGTTDPTDPEEGTDDTTEPSDQEGTPAPTEPAAPNVPAEKPVEPEQPTAPEPTVPEPEAPSVPEEDVVEEEAVAVGDVLWIKPGSRIYKSIEDTEDTAGKTVQFPYQIKITQILTDDDGETWYQFEFKGLSALVGLLLGGYTVVNADDTAATKEEAMASDEGDHACTCGADAPEDLSQHDDACPRKQYVLGLIQDEGGGYKFATEIYADWASYDEATRTDILHLLQAYVQTGYDVLMALLGSGSSGLVREFATLAEEYPDVTKGTCEAFFEKMMAAYSKAFDDDVPIIPTEQLRVVDALFSALQDALYNNFGYTQVQGPAPQNAIVTYEPDDAGAGDVVVDKKVSLGEDGVSEFLLTLESYVTGTSMDYTIPVDLVLVLDQSASMYAPMGVSSGLKNDTVYTENSSNLTRYALDCGKASEATGCSDLEAAFEGTTVDSTGLTFKQKVSQLGYLVAQSRSGGAAYCKEDHGNEHTDACKTYDWFVVQYVENDSEGEPWHLYRIKKTACPSNDSWNDGTYETDCVKYASFEEMGANHFYFYKSQTGALYDGILSFAKVLKDSGGDHRLAIAGFSGYDIKGERVNGNNLPGTCIYIDGEKIAYDSKYEATSSVYDSTITQEQYSFALMSVKNNYNEILDSLAAVKTDYYGTHQDVGFDMALNIINNATTVGTDLAGYAREKIVVLFTDGEPSGPKTGDVVAKAKEVKDTGAKVYTICTSTLTSDKREFLTVSSSDYPNATGTYGENSYAAGDPISSPKYAKTAENTEQLVKEFISIAEDVGGANIELGENTVLLDAISQYFTLPKELLEEIDSDGTPKAETLKKYITVYTADYNGTSFGTEALFEEAKVEISKGDDDRYSLIRVTNFDYSENFVSENGRGENNDFYGKKLIVKIAIDSRPGFLGGNNVVTNGTSSGIYYGTDDGVGSQVIPFPKPEANVPIKQNDSTAESNVYLGGYYSKTITSDQIKDNTQITIGGVTLDLSKTNYGLQDWQREYVNITVTIKDNGGNEFESTDLTADMEYTVTVTIKPKEAARDTSAGTPNGMDGKDSAQKNTIRVFKPELRFVDSEVWYGGAAPESYGEHLTKTRWVHNDTQKVSTDEAVTMLGDAPALSLTYTPNAKQLKTESDKTYINTKQDIPVGVTVKIVYNDEDTDDWDVTEYTTFLHTDCTGKTCGKPEDGEFWLHVKTCQLEIKKIGGADNESYVFDVYKGGTKYTEVTIWGNGSETIYELPLGTYTIQEDTGWSWRYGATYSEDMTLSSANPSGTITCTNTSNTDKWLNAFSTIVKNLFGVADTTQSS